MEQVLEKHLQRQAQILDILKDQEWHTIAEIKERIRFSRHTIRDDLQELQRYLEPALLMTGNHLGARLLLPEDLPVSYLYQRILDESKALPLLATLLVHEGITVTDLAEKLFISEATVRRELNRLQQALTPLAIHIQKKPLKLTGNEAAIIWNFHQYYLERYGSLEFAIPEAELTLISQLLEAYFRQHPRLQTANRQSFAYMNHLRILTYIRLQRVKHGHHQDNSQLIEESFILPLPLQMKVKSLYGITWDQEVFQTIFHPFLTKDFIRNYQEDLPDSPAWQQYQQAGQALLVKMIRKGFPASRQDYFLSAVWNYLNQINGPTKILYSEKEAFVENLLDYYPNFAVWLCQEAHNFLDSCGVSVAISDALLYEIVFLILMVWPEWHQRVDEHAPKLVAGLLFNTTYAHHLYLKQELKKHFPTRLTIEIVTENSLPALYANSRHFDLLITNLAYLDKIDYPVINISSNPTDQDYQRIRQLYQKLIAD